MIKLSSPYFKNQMEIISQYLKDAKFSIVVAVAFFTDERLFKILVDKARDGCIVYLLIQDNDTNSLSDINYTELNSKYGKFVMIDKEKVLNTKFCVIDGYTIIHGSYNWTHMAEKNYEQMEVREGDIKGAAKYITQFFEMAEPLTDIKYIETRLTSDKHSGIVEKMAERRKKAFGKPPPDNNPKDDN